eukprot:16427100-Heterocapsa_arctica.AAC.1
MTGVTRQGARQATGLRPQPEAHFAKETVMKMNDVCGRSFELAKKSTPGEGNPRCAAVQGARTTPSVTRCGCHARGGGRGEETTRRRQACGSCGPGTAVSCPFGLSQMATDTHTHK